MTHSSDFLIVGGGIAGASLAYYLAPHGTVTIIEMEEQIGYHTTGRSAAFFAESYGAKPVRYLTVASKDFFHNPPSDFTKTPLLNKRGALLIFTQEQQQIALASYEELKAMVPSIEMIDAHRVGELVPYITSDYAGAIFDVDCSDLDVASIHQGFITGAKASGATLQLGAVLTGAEQIIDGWHIKTTAGNFKTKTLINCAGAWADPVAEIIGAAPIGMAPLRRTMVNIKAESVDSAAPMVIDIEENYYVKPEQGSYLVSPCDETPSEPCDAQPEEIDIAYAAQYFSDATGIEVRRVDHSWAGLRTFASDRSPVIGFDPQVENFFWSVGQGGYGIQTAPAWGEAAASLLLTGDLPERLKASGAKKEIYDPARFSSAKV